MGLGESLSKFLKRGKGPKKTAESRDAAEVKEEGYFTAVKELQIATQLALAGVETEKISSRGNTMTVLFKHEGQTYKAELKVTPESMFQFTVEAKFTDKNGHEIHSVHHAHIDHQKIGQVLIPQFRLAFQEDYPFYDV